MILREAISALSLIGGSMRIKGKVGVVTLPGQFNYGNRLQNYAVVKACLFISRLSSSKWDIYLTDCFMRLTGIVVCLICVLSL